jgi:hypothetical protein
MMVRIMFALQIVGAAALLVCAIGNAVLGDWSGVALAATAAFLLSTI